MEDETTGLSLKARLEELDDSLQSSIRKESSHLRALIDCKLDIEDYEEDQENVNSMITALTRSGTSPMGEYSTVKKKEKPKREVKAVPALSAEHKALLDNISHDFPKLQDKTKELSNKLNNLPFQEFRI